MLTAGNMGSPPVSRTQLEAGLRGRRPKMKSITPLRCVLAARLIAGETNLAAIPGLRTRRPGIWFRVFRIRLELSAENATH